MYGFATICGRIANHRLLPSIQLAPSGLFAFQHMKILLLFVPLMVAQPSAGVGYVNVKLGYCCAEMYAHQNRDCWQTYNYRGAAFRLPAKLLEMRASDDPVAIEAAMDELVQQAQFSCDGVS